MKWLTLWGLALATSIIAYPATPQKEISEMSPEEIHNEFVRICADKEILKHVIHPEIMCEYSLDEWYTWVEYTGGIAGIVALMLWWTILVRVIRSRKDRPTTPEVKPVYSAPNVRRMVRPSNDKKASGNNEKTRDSVQDIEGETPSEQLEHTLSGSVGWEDADITENNSPRKTDTPLLISEDNPSQGSISEISWTNDETIPWSIVSKDWWDNSSLQNEWDNNSWLILTQLDTSLVIEHTPQSSTNDTSIWWFQETWDSWLTWSISEWWNNSPEWIPAYTEDASINDEIIKKLETTPLTDEERKDMKDKTLSISNLLKKNIAWYWFHVEYDGELITFTPLSEWSILYYLDNWENIEAQKFEKNNVISLSSLGKWVYKLICKDGNVQNILLTLWNN